jgi:small subunit ribosomal protein S20
LSAQPVLKKNKSAIKRARQTEAQELNNRSVRKKLKTLHKKVSAEVAGKNIDGASAALKEAISAIDKAAGKRIIHRNTASRRISGLSRLVNSISSSEAA